MDFSFIKNTVGKYPKEEGASPLSRELQSIVSKLGPEVFDNKDLVIGEIEKTELDEKTKSQFALVLKCSNIADYVRNSKSDMSVVDLDNAIHNVAESTGLTHDAALTVTVDVLYAFGLRFEVEFSPVLADGKIEKRLHAAMPSSAAEREIKDAHVLYDLYKKSVDDAAEGNADEETVKKSAEEAINAINNLCSCGISEGFYLLGLCHYYGDCGTAVDKEASLTFMSCASDMGNAKAASFLGNLYYCEDNPRLRDYTAAHYYFTRPGALAMGKTEQNALKDISMQRAANRLTLLFSVILAVMTAVFAVYFRSGIFSGSSRLGVGIPVVILSILTVAAEVVYNRRKPFNNIRPFMFVQLFLWAVYAFLLVLA